MIRNYLYVGLYPCHRKWSTLHPHPQAVNEDMWRHMKQRQEYKNIYQCTNEDRLIRTDQGSGDIQWPFLSGQKRAKHGLITFGIKMYWYLPCSRSAQDIQCTSLPIQSSVVAGPIFFLHVGRVMMSDDIVWYQARLPNRVAILPCYPVLIRHSLRRRFLTRFKNTPSLVSGKDGKIAKIGKHENWEKNKTKQTVPAVPKRTKPKHWPWTWRWLKTIACRLKPHAGKNWLDYLILVYMYVSCPSNPRGGDRRRGITYQTEHLDPVQDWSGR